MKETRTPWPMDVTHPTSRPSAWKPEGYLVVILPDADEGDHARASLEAAGTDQLDMKLYTAEQILANHAEYMARRTAPGRAVGSVIDDVEARELYLRYASQARSALWVRVGKDGVAAVLRTLADISYLRVRYYDDDGETDFRVD